MSCTFASGPREDTFDAYDLLSIVASLFYFFIGASMAELASAMPSSAGGILNTSI